MKKIIFPLIVISSLILSSIACSFSVNLPEVKTGPTQVLAIAEPRPDENQEMRLTVEMGAGDLNISGGADGLVEGEIRYNIEEWRPQVTRQSSRLRISQDNLHNVRLPTNQVVNDWHLSLGNTPLDLTISAGAYRGTLDLSAVPLTNLSISDGASQAEVRFEQPNLVEMTRFSYQTGASEVKIIGIGNANPEIFSFEGGAGSYTLDFSGQLQRDIDANVTTGISNLEIVVPQGVPARVTISGGLNNIQPRGTWTVNNNVYQTSGSGPQIHITVNMGLGNLVLVSN